MAIPYAQLKDLTDARQLIRDAITATETAADAILTETEQLQSLNSITKEAVQKAISNILEQSSFQDIVGQRLNKAERILARLSGEKSNDTDERTQQENQGLLDGPAAEGKGPSQDDIDKLFSSL